MKKIEDLWQEMETELENRSVGSSGGRLSRLATPDEGQRLHVGIEWPQRTRILLFSADVTALPPRTSWPQCRGLDLIFERDGEGRATMVIRLRDKRGADVFSALAEDLARRAVGRSEEEAGRRVLSALGRWQKFLAAKSRSLSNEARRGLWGELKVLEDVIMDRIGPEAAVVAWRGPTGAPQDFQYQGIAVEVKTRAAKAPAVVRISSEGQLHDDPWNRLFLIQIAVDEQDGAGETLPARIHTLRAKIANTSASELFEDHLLDAGWLDAEEDLHAIRGFILRECRCFHVEDEFPRLIPSVLPQGVGGVSYDLALDAAAGFSVSVEFVLAAMGPGGLTDGISDI